MSQSLNSESYVAQLRSYFSTLPSMGPRHQSPPSKVPSNLDSWTHVFVRDDSAKGPLVSPYKGPFRVLSRTPKIFKIGVNGCTEIVSVDRLKKAYVEGPTSFVDTTVMPAFDPLHTPLPTPSPTHTPWTTPPSSSQPALNKQTFTSRDSSFSGQLSSRKHFSNLSFPGIFGGKFSNFEFP
eukprot:XP_014783247.1 PREDICTED: uncharacterized protein LOC106878528 [Octopus bimaculoides]